MILNSRESCGHCTILLKCSPYKTKVEDYAKPFDFFLRHALSVCSRLIPGR